MSDAIERVKAAERTSEEIITGAHNEAAQMISEAKKLAENIIFDGVKAVREKVADSIAAARRTSADLMEKLAVELDGEIQALKDSAAAGKAEAVELIYKSLA